MTSYQEQRRSSAARAYTPEWEDDYERRNYDRRSSQQAGARDTNAYGPSFPAVADPLQQTSARRSSSQQPPPAAPMSIPRLPGYQSSSSYGSAQSSPPNAQYQQQYQQAPQGGQGYGYGYPPQPPQAQYGTSPSNYAPASQPNNSSPLTNRPMSQTPGPPRADYQDYNHNQNHNYEEAEAVTFDHSADYRPSSQRRSSRSYSHTSQSRPDTRRLSAHDAYRIPSNDQDNRRDSRSSQSRSRDPHEGNSDFEDGYEAGLAAGREGSRPAIRERRESKASTHSRSGRSSGDHGRSSGDHRRRRSASGSKGPVSTTTYGEDVLWAVKGVKKFFSSSREP